MPVLSPYVTGLRPWAVYNEFNDEAAEWIRQLMKFDLIAPGEVDERSIVDVSADDYRKFTQQHFFAGVGTWSYCLRAGGIADDFPALTGSPPCQPFSVAGRSEGKDDDRHLAPKFAELVEELGVGLIFGEQVSSKLVMGPACGKCPAVLLDGEGNEIPPEWAWLDALHDQLEAALYACGAQDLPAAGFGAPHIRQRLVLFAYHHALATGALDDAQRARLERLLGDVGDCHKPGWQHTHQAGPAAACGFPHGLADDGSKRVRDQGCGQDACAPGGVQEEGLQRQRLRNDSWDDGRRDDHMAHPERQQRLGRRSGEASTAPGSVERAERLRDAGELADDAGGGWGEKCQNPGRRHEGDDAQGWRSGSVDGRSPGDMAQPDGERLQGVGLSAGPAPGGRDAEQDLEAGRVCEADILDLAAIAEHSGSDDLDACLDDALARLDSMRPGPTNGFWRDADWVFSRDGKWRPIEPGSVPLVDGASSRVGSGGDPGLPVPPGYAQATSEGRKMRLKGYGNGIVTEPTVEHIANCVGILDQLYPGWRWRAISLAESLTKSVS